MPKERIEVSRLALFKQCNVIVQMQMTSTTYVEPSLTRRHVPFFLGPLKRQRLEPALALAFRQSRMERAARCHLSSGAGCRRP